MKKNKLLFWFDTNGENLLFRAGMAHEIGPYTSCLLSEKVR